MKPRLSKVVKREFASKGRLNAQGSAFDWIRGEEGDWTLFNKVMAAYRTADEKYSLLKPKHELLWAEFLASRFIDPSLSEEHHKAIAHLLSLEALQDTYHHIQAIQNLSTGWFIAAVEFLTPVGTTVATSWVEVESVLSLSLQIWFTQAHSSPFLQPPLAPLIGALGTSQAAKEILNGTFICLPDILDSKSSPNCKTSTPGKCKRQFSTNLQ